MTQHGRPQRGRLRRVGAVLGLAALAAGLTAACSSDGSEGSSGPRAIGPSADDVPGGTYLSLGDSYAQGYQPPVDGQVADYTKGYAYLVPALAEARGYDLELVNLGCGGATVGSLADDDGCDVAARSPGGPVYDDSQLEAAVAYLEDHPGEVDVLTVSIGGNDVTACARGADDPIACVTEAVEEIEDRLGEVLPDLREAAGPDTVLLGLTYPDVILGAYVSDDAAARSLAELSVVAFEQVINPMLRAAYEAVDGIFVDVTEATGAYTPLTETTTLDPYGEIPQAVAEVCTLTWFCERADIHPRDAGYQAIAELVVAALPAR